MQVIIHCRFVIASSMLPAYVHDYDMYVPVLVWVVGMELVSDHMVLWFGGYYLSKDPVRQYPSVCVLLGPVGHYPSKGPLHW